jgi:hypothetical protein
MYGKKLWTLVLAGAVAGLLLSGPVEGADLTVTIPDAVNTKLPEVHGGTALQHVQACVDSCVEAWIAQYNQDLANKKQLQAAFANTTSTIQTQIEAGLELDCWTAYQAANAATQASVQSTLSWDPGGNTLFMEAFWSASSGDRTTVKTALSC